MKFIGVVLAAVNAALTYEVVALATRRPDGTRRYPTFSDMGTAVHEHFTTCSHCGRAPERRVPARVLRPDVPRWHTRTPS